MPIPPTMDELLDSLLKRLNDGTYPPGSQLPSGQTLADEFNVSQSTISRAVAKLRKQGILIGRPGRGVFVAEDRPR